MSPIEVTDKEVFKKIVERAVECRVYRDSDKGFAKVKARTKSRLVTIKIPLEELDAFLKELKCQSIVEF
ncbi:MAG: 5'-nucleotidase [Desulfurococcaceae archaeon]|uniref:5'-nucleotidase n=1 Tax=Staphylothermus marinus TaxID=2280 RepID=A0A7C4JLY3_STAMA